MTVLAGGDRLWHSYVSFGSQGFVDGRARAVHPSVVFFSSLTSLVFLVTIYLLLDCSLPEK